MRKSRFTEEQRVRIPREAENLQVEFESGAACPVVALPGAGLVVTSPECQQQASSLLDGEADEGCQCAVSLNETRKDEADASAVHEHFP